MKSLFRFLNVLPRSKEEKLAQLTCELVNANNEAEKLRDEKEKISKSFKKLSVSFHQVVDGRADVHKRQDEVFSSGMPGMKKSLSKIFLG